jgi:transcription initiation factor IIE alpha subunit
MKINYGKTPKTELRKIKSTLNEKVDLYDEELEEAKTRIKRRSIKRLIQNLMRRIERIDKHLKTKRKSRRLLYAQGKIS